MRKKRLVRAAVSFLILLCFVATNPDLGRSEELKIYNDSRYNFTIDYPSSWGVEVEEGQVTFTAPSDSANDSFLENVNIIVTKFDYSPSLDELEQMQESAIGQIRKQVDQLDLVKKSRCQINGRGAIYAITEVLLHGKWLKQMQYAVPVENVNHIITYTALRESFDDHLDEAETIIKSFKITE